MDKVNFITNLFFVIVNILNIIMKGMVFKMRTACFDKDQFLDSIRIKLIPKFGKHKDIC